MREVGKEGIMSFKVGDMVIRLKISNYFRRDKEEYDGSKGKILHITKVHSKNSGYDSDYIYAVSNGDSSTNYDVFAEDLYAEQRYIKL